MLFEKIQPEEGNFLHLICKQTGHWIIGHYFMGDPYYEVNFPDGSYQSFENLSEAILIVEKEIKTCKDLMFK